ncbi:DNA/RNA helicase [Bacillus solimangrovi]|uniref:DNA/RNA helicase n=2 Tax=Bacillus solimangrovi TaxID=1305675 RepID=A0A1E5LDN8_9BACI|nr:DNA/RNA helicase [Bacillus solimangrovi]
MLYSEQLYTGKPIIVPEALAQSLIDMLPISECTFNETLPKNKNYPYVQPLQQFLQHKRLPINLIPFEIQVIHDHYLNGFIRYQKGLIKNNNEFQCQRCGNHDQHLFARMPCVRCKKECMYCRKCLVMGRVNACTMLISWCGEETTHIQNNHHCDSLLTLSTGQQTASNKVVEAIQEKKQLLVWAVCGSGKTEVLFSGIEYALNQGLTICIATPRTDVVLELAPRLKKAFPTVEVVSLYGNSKDKERNGQLMISTTHQLLRYYRTFEVMILDEVDAFPYRVEPMLQYALNQSRKIDSSLIYLTATPDKQLLQSEDLDIITIPARYHRHPLPVPNFKWCGNWQKALEKELLPYVFVSWLSERIDKNKQVLLFVPHIRTLEQVVILISELDRSVTGVHAEDRNRKEKVERFRNQEIMILVTTTILERGITVPNIDVAVLGAEDNIFTESALVQIAGRVGRSPKFPTGVVTFFHYGITNEMVKARRQIERMNREASEKGLIDLK